MERDLYVTMMYNDLDEMLCVTFLDDDPTDAQDKAKRYAKQLHGVIVKHDRVPDSGGMTITMANRRPRKEG